MLREAKSCTPWQAHEGRLTISLTRRLAINPHHDTLVGGLDVSVKEDLRRYALSLGIDHLAVAAATPFPKEEELLNKLAARGACPPFTENNITLRCYPEQVLPGARSIVVAAMSYFVPGRQRPAQQGPRGWVSRYARVQDYHQVLSQKLNQLAVFLQERTPVPVNCRVYVDRGPFLERAVAERSGLGWFGKNSMIYVPDYGSWVFLGELITDLALEPDTRREGPSCGSCDLCMRACPTGAIVAPFRVDIRRCLSYITQMPGQVPLEFRKAMGRRIWGCDVCQAACPWNKGVRSSRLGIWQLSETAAPNLIALLTIPKSEFRRQFGHSPMAWRGKGTLQRNAAIALGNVGDRCAESPLAERLLHDPKPVLRGACAWALGQLGGEKAREALLAAQDYESSEEVQREIAQALTELH